MAISLGFVDGIPAHKGTGFCVPWSIITSENLIESRSPPPPGFSSLMKHVWADGIVLCMSLCHRAKKAST